VRTALNLQLAKGPVRVGMVSGGAITIRDVDAEGEGAAAEMTADEEFARRLQAKMDAQSMGGRCVMRAHRVPLVSVVRALLWC
jgi:hypothetical protein